MSKQEGAGPIRCQPSSALLKVLAEDMQVVSYRPHFARMTGSVLAAILLQQLLHRWMQTGRQAFYKFKEPCQHSDYRAGDSWCEELAFTRREFDNALSLIGTKVTKGSSKNDLMAYRWPGLPADPASESYRAVWAEIMRHVVIYWTDSNRVTWYWLNEVLLERVVSVTYSGNARFRRYIYKGGKRRYLGKGGKRRQRVKAESAVTCSTESPLSVVVDPGPLSRSGNQQQQRDPTPAEREAFQRLAVGEVLWRPWMDHPPEHVLACALHVVHEPGVNNPVGLLRAMLEENKGAPASKYRDWAARALAGASGPDAPIGPDDPEYTRLLDLNGWNPTLPVTGPLTRAELAAWRPPEAAAATPEPPRPIDDAGSLNDHPPGSRLTWREIWLAVRNQLELQLNASTFETWLKDARAVRFHDGVLLVSTRHAYAPQWLSEHLPHINDLVTRLAGQPVTVQYVTAEPELVCV